MKKSQFFYGSRPGFKMTFENGWTVSVQWHNGAYCENKGYEYAPGFEQDPTCQSAEIAAWDSKGKWYQFEHDTVEGYKSTDEVAEFIHMIKSL